MCDKRRKYFQLKEWLLLLMLNVLKLSSALLIEESTTTDELTDTANCTGGYADVPLNCEREKQQIKLDTNTFTFTLTCTGISARNLILPTQLNITIESITIKNCTINEKVFENLLKQDFSKVESFTFSESNILSMRKDTFEKFKNLKFFYLTNNHKQNLPAELLSTNKELLHFIMLNQVPFELPQGLLKNLPKLEYVALNGPVENMATIDFYNTNLSALPASILEDQRALLNLLLEGNQFRALPQGLLENKQRLQAFELKNIAAILVLPTGLLANKPDLADVNINCGLQRISADIFENSFNLKKLTLAGNKLNALPPRMLQNQTQLGFLNLTQNGLSSLPAQLLLDCKKLETFMLHERRAMKSLPAGLLANLPKLKEVQLAGGFTSLPADLLQNSSALECLTLSHSDLTKLPANLLACQLQLHCLHLHDNCFEDLPESLLSHNEQLEYFTLSNRKQLKQLPDRFLHYTPHLLELELSCGLEIMPSNEYSSFLRLKLLNLSSNKLITLPKTFWNISIMLHLQTLNMSHNQLKGTYNFAAWTFVTGHKPKTIDLSYNQIDAIKYSAYAAMIIGSSRVDLSHNNISRPTWLETKNFDSAKLIAIDTSDNPIDCTCELLRFKRYLLHGCRGEDCQKALRQAQYLRCQTPAQLYNRTLIEISPKELLCPLDPKQCMENCNCFRRPYDRTLLMNCTQAGLQQMPQLPQLQPLGLTAMELDISYNNITELLFDATLAQANITKIDAAHNQIVTIVAQQLPRHLSQLNLSHNLLQSLNDSLLTLFNSSNTLKFLDLSHNNWTCNCKTLSLMNFIKERPDFIHNVNEIRCASNTSATSLNKLSAAELCPAHHLALIILTSLGVVLLLLLIITLRYVYYRKQHNIKAWLYAHRLCLCWLTIAEIDEQREFDAFISYSHRDLWFLEQHLVPQLEQGPIPYRLCIDVRHWLAGENITHCIARSCEQSKRVVIVMTKDFLRSVWGIFELRTAHAESRRDGRTGVIIITFDEVLDDLDNLDVELRNFLYINLYLRWGDPLFWQKLRYALPHPRGGNTANNNLEMSEL